MKRLEDLKTELIDNKLSRFYVFYGVDVGIRKHYVDKINTYYDEKYVLDTYEEVQPMVMSNSLFSTKKLFVVINDDDFSNLSSTKIQQFIQLLRNDDYCCIFLYDNTEFENTTLFKEFGNYCTEFSTVSDSIALEFIESEIHGLSVDCETELASNCENLYSNILLETDKIKCYKDEYKSTYQNSYESLKVKNQMLKKDQKFNCNEFMNRVLLGTYSNIQECCNLRNDDECCRTFFGCLLFMFNDFLIAGLCKQFGRSSGKSKAYLGGLTYARAKTICEFDLPETAEYYYTCAYKVATLDNAIKIGRVNVSDIIDRFLSTVI